MSRGSHACRNIRRRPLCREGAQMRTHRDPLVQLRNSRNTMTQFRLADRHGGQQKAIIELEIRQQTEILKSFDDFNRLRFIHERTELISRCAFDCSRSLSVRNRPAFDCTRSSPN